jgi:hypothetical protein
MRQYNKLGKAIVQNSCFINLNEFRYEILLYAGKADHREISE